MKQIIISSLLTSFLLINQFIIAQTISIGVGGSASLHLEATSSENQNIPEQYRQNIEYPSIAKFYNDDTPINFSLSYEINKSEDAKTAFSLIYEQSQLQNTFTGSENILGKSMDLESIIITGGYGHATNEKNTTFIIGFIGIAVKNYKGKSSTSGIELVHNYNTATALRFGGNLELKTVAGSSLSFVVGVTFDYGSVDRDEVEFFENGNKVARAIPEGDITIYDNVLALQVCIKYSFELDIF